MTWTTFSLRTTTPLLLGDEAIPRVSSLRGALRFWFRALVGTRVGNDVATLRELESMVFGSLEQPTKVRLRIPQPPGGTPPGTVANVFDAAPADAQWIGYLLGQGHATVKSSGPQLSRHTLPANTAYTLKVKFDAAPHINSLLMSALWLTCTYGGLGARTRRAFGGMRIEHVEGPVPKPWTTENAVTPGLDFYTGLDTLLPTQEHPMLSQLDAHLAEFGRPLRPLANRPDYPTVSDTFTVSALSEFSASTWQATAAWIGERYRHFRAPEDNKGSETKYQPKVKTKEYRAFTEPGQRLPGRRNNEFPLGAFGLPVIFKEGIQVNATSSGALRRASPVWIRIINDPESGEWRIFSFAFLNEYFSGDPAPTVNVRAAKQGPRELIVPNELVESEAARWLNEVRRPEDVS